MRGHRAVTAALAVALGVAFGAGCSRPSTDVAPASSNAPGTDAAPAKPAAAAPSAAPKGGLVTFKGQGQLEPGDLYVPGKGEVPNAKEWEGTKWRGDEASTQLGAVTFEITVDEGTGKVTGSLDGASGPAVLSGIVLGPQVSATITRKDPTDMGLTGTFVGTREGDVLKGPIRLSIGTARILRKGDLEGKRVP